MWCKWTDCLLPTSSGPCWPDHCPSPALGGTPLGGCQVPRTGQPLPLVGLQLTVSRVPSRRRMCLVSRLWSCLNVRVEWVDVSLDVLTLLLDWKEPCRMISDVFCWLPYFRVHMNLFLSGGIRKVVTKTMLSTLTITGFSSSSKIETNVWNNKLESVWLRKREAFCHAVSRASTPACSPLLRKQTGLPWLWGCHHSKCIFKCLTSNQCHFFFFGVFNFLLSTFPWGPDWIYSLGDPIVDASVPPALWWLWGEWTGTLTLRAAEDRAPLWCVQCNCTRGNTITLCNTTAL